MRVQVQSRLVFDFSQPTQTIALFLAANSADQRIETESLIVTPSACLVETLDHAAGARLLRGSLVGRVEIDYRAVVTLASTPALIADLVETPWSALPADVVPFLMSSRYCPVDTFLRFAKREFGHVPPGGARALAILDWLHANIDYRHGVSDGNSDASATLIDRAGVCRDFTHLGVTLCRAAGMPARAVSAYALGLDPPDFHAVFEVYLENQWRLVDPTRLADTAGMVRIAQGRDAADIAFLTTSGPVIQREHRVSVTEFLSPALVKPSYHANTVEEAA